MYWCKLIEILRNGPWQTFQLMGQSIRVACSLLVMLAITGLYHVAVVPWIEPTLRESTNSASTFNTANFLGQQKQKLTQFFPPRSWQLGPTKVLESSNVMLLMKDFKEVGENRLRLEPLTIIAFETDAEPDKWNQPVVILNAEQALLQFSELNLAFGKIGDLVGGQLLGSVQITRKSADGKHEPLDIITSDVMLATDRIETRKDVQFLMGKHQGNGRHLIAQFQEGPGQAKQKGPNISGLSILELVHVDHILLSTEGRGLLGDASPAPGGREGGNQMYASAPVEIRCRGPFVFDGRHHVATFRDRVQVRRLVASGVPDQLQAELLEVHFQGPEDGAPDEPEQEDQHVSPSDAGEMKNLKLRRLVAVGNPFRLTAPSVSATAQGKQLIYDLMQQRIEVVGQPMAVLTKDQYRLESPSLQYELAEKPGHLGRVWAAGPGDFTATSPSDDSATPGGNSRIRWKGQFRIEPQNGEYAVAVEKEAVVAFDGKGQISGDQLYVWLRDLASSESGRQRLMPHRMQGVGRIAIDTPQLVGRTNELRAWFEHDPPSPDSAAEPGRFPQNQTAANSPSEDTPEEDESAENPGRFRLSGEQLQLVLRFDGKRTHLDSATITGQVQLAELPGEDQAVDPFTVRGNVVQLLNASDNHAEIHVAGQPGVISGRGLQLFSGQFRVNQRQGRIWSEGPGELIFPLDRDFQGRKLAVPEYFNVQWQGGLQAQHDQITFDRAVQIKGRQSQLSTAKLTIVLNHPINFQDTAPNRELAAKSIECSGGVQLYNRNVEGGILKSIDQFDGKTLTINQNTGDIHAQGPGTAKSVLAGKPAFGPSPSSASPSSDANQLTFLRVDFVSHVSGNLRRKEVTFHKVDRAFYGPVSSWEEQLELKAPAAMKQTEVSLRCDQLTVVQLPDNSDFGGGAEILATGNSEVQGKMFNAWADRISYSTAKQMLTLSGNGRNPVQLVHQKQIGDARQTLAAGKIEYWPESRHFKLHDGKSIDVSGAAPAGGGVPKIPGLR